MKSLVCLFWDTKHAPILSFRWTILPRSMVDLCILYVTFKYFHYVWFLGVLSCCCARCILWVPESELQKCPGCLCMLPDARHMKSWDKSRERTLIRSDSTLPTEQPQSLQNLSPLRCANTKPAWNLSITCLQCDFCGVQRQKMIFKQPLIKRPKL